ncbi:MAG TPA: hypothetical protein VFM93_14085 [Candidatus Limnocylindria bacterium]|nr:hypothetical protein [Candidatus Limnocylindria bacterium]
MIETKALVPAKAHFVPRPLVEPPRYRRVSKVGKPPADPLGVLLEQWIAELRAGYTIAGE